MPFKTPITVKAAVNNIHAKRYLLPNIRPELTPKWQSVKNKVILISE